MDNLSVNSADGANENCTALQNVDAEKLAEFKAAFIEAGDALHKAPFVEKFEAVFEASASEAIEVFKEIDKDDSGAIRWYQFVDHLIVALEPTFSQSLELGKLRYIKPPHVKRDSIMKIARIESQNYFCYAIISKYGRVGLYDGNLDFLTSYSVIMAREDVRRNDDERRRRNRWITDAIFMPDVLMFVFANTTRSLTIYDAAGLKHLPLWLILGMNDIIQSMAYKPPDVDKKRRLILGTDDGHIHAMTFQSTKDSLLRRKHNDKLTLFYYRELVDEKDYVIMKKIGKIHEESVKNIEFFRDDHSLISCSRDPYNAVVITDSEGSRQYTFKMRRGANCFAISDALKILISGSDDGTLRLWNSVVSAKPLTVLCSHKCGIVDIAILENSNIFFSCSRDGVLKMWDLKETKCLHNLLLKFPQFEVMGKSIEWGKSSFCAGPKRKSDHSTEKRSICACNVWERSCLLISSCNMYAKIELVFLDGKERDFDAAVLPPPPLQNSFLIPKDWKICEEKADVTEYNKPDVDKEEINLDRIKFILDKDMLTEMGQKSEINYKIATVESKKLQMQWAVEHCAPYLALDIYETKEITLPTDLPMPSSKRVRNLVDKTRKMLADATARSIIFSDTSTSSKSPRSRSSRSSIIDFDC